MVRNIEIFWIINGKQHTRYTTDIEEAISFLYRSRFHKEVEVAAASYVIDEYGHHRIFSIDKRGALTDDTDLNDDPPTKPGDPGWDPELTDWFYEDD